MNLHRRDLNVGPVVLPGGEEAYALSLESGYEYATTITRFVYQSPTTPRQWFDYDMASRERTLQSPEPPGTQRRFSLRWLARCLAEFRRIEAEDPPPTPQALFPIVQGGIHAELRREAAAAIAGMHDWPGYGIGGLSVGEPKPVMHRILERLEPGLIHIGAAVLAAEGVGQRGVAALVRGAQQGVFCLCHTKGKCTYSAQSDADATNQTCCVQQQQSRARHDGKVAMTTGEFQESPAVTGGPRLDLDANQ